MGDGAPRVNGYATQLRGKAGQTGFPCDLSIQSGGGIRKDIPKGPITYMDLYEVYPWQDNMIELTMTGKQIRNYLQSKSLDAAIFFRLAGVRHRRSYRQYQIQRHAA